MADELLFAVSNAHATPASPTTLAEAGFTERGDLQEWVIANPGILGPGVRIVTFEFDRWWSSTGKSPVDRLDVLGLDTDGRLVVAELKRDEAPDTVEMQAIKYAAMVSRFTAETLGKYHARFLSRKGEHVTEDEALEALANHVEAKALDPDLLKRPRIVLVAGTFPPVVTATAVWLREMGVERDRSSAGDGAGGPRRPHAARQTEIRSRQLAVRPALGRWRSEHRLLPDVEVTSGEVARRASCRTSRRDGRVRPEPDCAVQPSTDGRPCVLQRASASLQLSAAARSLDDASAAPRSRRPYRPTPGERG